MENQFLLSYGMACHWWSRLDLEPRPQGIQRVAEVLEQADIQVYFVSLNSDGWLICEPRPEGVYEALSGKLASSERPPFLNFPAEDPGQVLKILAAKGIYFGA